MSSCDVYILFPTTTSPMQETRTFLFRSMGLSSAWSELIRCDWLRIYPIRSNPSAVPYFALRFVPWYSGSLAVHYKSMKARKGVCVLWSPVFAWFGHPSPQYYSENDWLEFSQPIFYYSALSMSPVTFSIYKIFTKA